jgi:hypothetical protein
MTEIQREHYTLLLSYNPCMIFWHLGEMELHGLNYKSCMLHQNTTESAYIAGWCNFYPDSDKFFVFINLSRCTDDLETTLLIFHEMIHAAMIVYDWNLEHEEQIVTYAENETRETFNIIKQYLTK